MFCSISLSWNVRLGISWIFLGGASVSFNLCDDLLNLYYLQIIERNVYAPPAVTAQEKDLRMVQFVQGSHQRGSLLQDCLISAPNVSSVNCVSKGRESEAHLSTILLASAGHLCHPFLIRWPSHAPHRRESEGVDWQRCEPTWRGKCQRCRAA